MTLPWVLKLADSDLIDLATREKPMRDAINIHDGKISYQPVADSFHLTCHPLVA